MLTSRSLGAPTLLACAGLLTTLCALSPIDGAPRRAKPGAPAAELIVEDAGFVIDPELVYVRPAINAQGQVAGPSVRPPAAPLPGPQPGASLIFDAHRTNAALTVQQDLFVTSFGFGPPADTFGFYYSNAYGINLNTAAESAQVVGEARAADGRNHAMRFSDNATPKMQDLGTLGGDYSSAYAINDSGQVAGEAQLGFGEGPIGPFGESAPVHAFRYTDGVGMEDLGTLVDGFYSSAGGINEAGQVVGQSETVINDQFLQHAFLYTDGDGMQDLGALPDSYSSVAYSINDLTPPHIVGESLLIAGKGSFPRAVRWRNGTLLNLGVLPGHSISTAADVNNSGTVVGASGSFAETVAMIWRDKNGNNQSNPGEMEDLNSLIPAGSGWVLHNATGINDAGQIVGVGTLEGEPRVFRLTPAGPPNQAPQLSNPSVTPPSRTAPGGDFTLSVTATDDRGLASVIAEVNLPAGGTQAVPLTQVGMTNVYSGIYTAPPNTGTTTQSYTATFRATDTNDVTTSLSLPGSFTVTRDQPPVIVSTSITPPTLPSAGGQFTLTARVTDDFGVSGVAAVISGPHAIPNVTLTLQSGTATDGTYSGTFTVPANAGTEPEAYSAVVTATDTAGRTDAEQTGTALVLPAGGEDVDPEILACSLSPQFLPPPGGAVSITAQVTDNAGVALVEAQVTRPDSSVAVVPLTHTSGNSYAGTYNAPRNTAAAGVLYSVELRAVDTSGNEDTADCGDFRVAGIAETPGGRVVIDPLKLNFGRVLLRHQKTLGITIRQQGGSADSVTFFRAGTLDPPFQVVAPVSALGTPPATPSGWIALRRGQSRTIRVVFRPQALGTFIDNLPIETTDPLRPLVDVRCAGKGCRNP